MLKIADVTIEKLRNGELADELPEFYELKDIVENNEWHTNSSVFDHTIVVLEKLEELLKKTNKKINSYLNQIVDKNTRSQLLFLGTVFHDIGKKETTVKDGESISCPGHEKCGAIKTNKILDRFDLSDTEKTIVIQIIGNHGVVHHIANPKNEKSKEEYEDFKSKFSNTFLESTLLGMADTLGGQLRDNLPDEFDFRMKFYYNVIDNY